MRPSKEQAEVDPDTSKDMIYSNRLMGERDLSLSVAQQQRDLKVVEWPWVTAQRGKFCNGSRRWP